MCASKIQGGQGRDIQTPLNLERNTLHIPFILCYQHCVLRTLRLTSGIGHRFFIFTFTFFGPCIVLTLLVSTSSKFVVVRPFGRRCILVAIAGARCCVALRRNKRGIDLLVRTILAFCTVDIKSGIVNLCGRLPAQCNLSFGITVCRE
ncbi:hypothetical protein B188_07330 [Candidatus Brocadiaceae bacterium B188]|nr:hypothetical protein B188_07330 [Candidatus Brocadiaceae bacterium B188]